MPVVRVSRGMLWRVEAGVLVVSAGVLGVLGMLGMLGVWGSAICANERGLEATSTHFDSPGYQLNVNVLAQQCHQTLRQTLALALALALATKLPDT